MHSFTYSCNLEAEAENTKESTAMVNRNLLRDMMSCAFRRTAMLYEEQLITSERSLQAVMWHELREQFKKHKKLTYKIFIEPRLQLPGSIEVKESVCVPDLVVCNRDRVSA